jgi:hypothetical protein
MDFFGTKGLIPLGLGRGTGVLGTYELQPLMWCAALLIPLGIGSGTEVFDEASLL